MGDASEVLSLLSLLVKNTNTDAYACQFVVSGSDCGNVFVWDKRSEGMLWMHKGDEEVGSIAHADVCRRMLTYADVC